MLLSPFLNLQRQVIASVPCLIFRPQAAASLYPTIFYYHGWKSGKDKKALDASLFALHGFQVIVPDALHHGERDPLDYDAPGVLDAHFWKVIQQNVAESGELLAQASQRFQADPQRIGLIGNSMGGFSVAGIFGQQPQVKALVVLNGSCAWVRASQVFRERDGLPPAPPEHLAALARFDLLLQPERLLLRPVLLLHGEQDTVVPPDSQIAFYQEVRARYAASPEKLRMLLIPRLDHMVTNHMLEQSLTWFQTYL